MNSPSVTSKAAGGEDGAPGHISIDSAAHRSMVIGAFPTISHLIRVGWAPITLDLCAAKLKAKDFFFRLMD